MDLLNENILGESDIRADLLSATSKCYRISDKATAQSIGKEFKGKSMGIYRFSDPKENSLESTYIGSSLVTRPIYHYYTSLKPSSMSFGNLYTFFAKNGGIQNSNYKVLIAMPSYTDLWFETYGEMPNNHINPILIGFSSFSYWSL